MKTKLQTPSLAAALVAVIALLLCVTFNQPVSAATDTWNGGAVPNGNWLTPGNWNGVTPKTNDLLIFAGSTQTATTNNFLAGTPFNNISFSSGSSAFTVNGNSMTLSEPIDAGSGQISGGSINSVSANAETLRIPILLADGNHKITSSGGGTLKLNGAVTRSTGAVVTMSGNINVAGGLSTNGNANGILGGWAIYNNNWATLDANSNVVAYSTYTDVSGGGTIASDSTANVRIPTAGTAISLGSATTAINSLLFSAGTANQTVNVGAGNKLVLGQNGGIYNSSSIASGGTYRNLVIGANVAGGGILTAGDGINPAQITFGSPPLASGSSGFLTVNSSITDNGSAPVTVVVAGAYVSLNGGGPAFGAFQTNTYSGGTYVLQGRVSQANNYTIGLGPVHIFPSGQVNIGWPITNEFFIEGSGTTENNGMGALRLYSASLAAGITANLSGTIHLTGNANVCADNIAAAANRLGFSGKITGPGSLGIGSPTATSRSGVLNIGSTNGAFAIPNDYAGDTLINGIAAGTIGSTLRIADPADNNIMPHSTTGSYAGGKTGNLILNGVAATRQAIFDLNGSTQTINGLSSTATSPANNLIQDNGAGNGLLIVGDSDATSTFGGVIQNAIRITKIGNGTLTLSGANAYSGDTLISTGRLVTTTASVGAGNYSVANNAALGVTAASLGGTLAINNLAFGTSALQLNAAAFGNPTAALVNVTGALAMNGTVTVSLSGVGLTAGGPFVVLHYAPGSRSGVGTFVLNNSPRVVATLNDDTINGDVKVTIISADSAVKWNGGAGGNWDINDTGNTIWQTVPSGSTTYYIEAGSGNDSTLFNDTLTGTSNVNLTTTLSPQTITVSNSAVNYLFAGPGKITGTTGLTKQGTGTLTIANSGNNDFSGDIALTTGTLVISNSSSLANNISGTGALIKNGSGTLALSGDNSTFTGPVAVNGGILSVLNSVSLASASSTTVAGGATLDIGVNSVALALEPITVSGSGVGGNGAIVNSSGYSGGAIATSFQNLTLAGDTTIGGPGRLDFRSTDPAGGNDATLSTTGHAYKLTKVSISTLQLASVQIDPALGDIDVQAGTLSIQGNMPSLGNPANTITVFGAAILQFSSVSSELNKVLVLKDTGVVNNSAGANTYDGPVTLQGNGVFNVGGVSLLFTNVISGTGTLSKVTGTAPITLSASNTYTGDTLISAGMLLLTEPGDIRASRTITIGSGAILDVSGRADQTLTVPGGHSLTGSGSLNGNLTNLPASTVAPGNPATIGTLTINGDASLAGTNVMKLNHDSAASDRLSVGGNLYYGGTLIVTNLSGTLAPGDSFQLFTASTYNGSFTSIVPTTPGAGLKWDTSTLSSGILGVSQPLTITNFTLSGTSLVIQGAGGSPNANYVVLTSTNVGLPLIQWTPMVTNTFDSSGNFNFTTNINNSLPQQFYMLSQ